MHAVFILAGLFVCVGVWVWREDGVSQKKCIENPGAGEWRPI